MNKDQSVKSAEEEIEEASAYTEVPQIQPQVDVIPFSEGDIVYHKVDEQNCRGVVCGVMRQPGHYKYLVRWAGMDDLLHFDFELSKTPVSSTSDDAAEDDDDEVS